MHERWHPIWIARIESGKAAEAGMGESDIVEKMSVSSVFLNSSEGDEMKLRSWRKESLGGLFKRGEKW